VGVSKYQYNEIYEKTSSGKPMNLPSSHRAARMMSDVLAEVGQLSDLKVLTNEEATRDNIERAVSAWLPAVSRPGDTIVIYMAGHGFQVPTRKLHPAYAPHDTVLPGMLLEMIQEAKAHPDAKETQELMPALRVLVPLLQEAKAQGRSAEEMEDAIIERTMVTCESFGRWLQGLDGREVIVILDSCHSGGFAVEGQENPDAGKGLDVASTPLADPILRLTAIGQKDCVLLAACGTDQEAWATYDTPIMTHALLTLLRSARNSVDIKNCHEYCKAEMNEFFKQRPSLKVHEVRLFGYSHPLYVKP
jgi:hypothetical protein